MTEWSTLLLDRFPTSEEMEIWGRNGTGQGVVCGPASSWLAAFDIDNNEDPIKRALFDVLPDAEVPGKVGQKGGTLFYRGPSLQTRQWKIDGKVVCEILVAGRQTILPPTIHPDTRAPYRWIDGPALWDVSPEDLAALPDDFASRVTEALRPYGYGEPTAEPKRTATNGAGPRNVGNVPSGFEDLNRARYAETPYGRVNAAAMESWEALDQWVPHLGLVGLKKTPNRYEAVASWRASSNPKLAENKRQRALSITPDGVRDFADPTGSNGKGYTPVDLVMVARSLAQEAAFEWLCERLGIPVCAKSDAPPMNSDVADVTDVTPNEISDLSVTSARVDDVTDVTVPPEEEDPEASGDGNDDVTDVADVTDVTPSLKEKIVPSDARPCFRVFNNRVLVKLDKDDPGQKFGPGVGWFDVERKDNKAIGSHKWVCSPLHVTAQAFDERDEKSGSEFGRVLKFQNTLGRWSTWTMPMEMLGGDSSEIRAVLLSKGVRINPSRAGRDLLNQYLQSGVPKERVRCSSQIGWYGSSSDLPDLFVLPSGTIGEGGESLVFQTTERLKSKFSTSGTLEEWQEHIASRAVGNPMLTLAISAGFAGCLILKCNAESGGIHNDGDSSMGKSALLEAAASSWGGHKFIRSWNSTANGMEGAASLSNDCCIPLDEIGECEARDIGRIVYALGNGVGRQRAARDGRARPVMNWRVFVISSGEHPISDAMLAGGHKVKAGQEVRILSIPSKRTHGVWDNLHDLPNGAAFTDEIRSSARKYYGVAGPEFLEKLVRETDDLRAALEELKVRFKPEGGQEARAASRLALVALAGVLASKYEIVRWPAGASLKAAMEAFKVWKKRRGKGNSEPRRICERVLDFINAHGDARFSEIDENGRTVVVRDVPVMVRDRAGWWQQTSTGRTYYFTSGGMREALEEFPFDSTDSRMVFSKPASTMGYAASMISGLKKVWTIASMRTWSRSSVPPRPRVGTAQCRRRHPSSAAKDCRSWIRPNSPVPRSR
jgi:putative DNA primase/helicase